MPCLQLTCWISFDHRVAFHPPSLTRDSFWHRFFNNMKKHGAGQLARHEDADAYRGVELWLLRLRTMQLRRWFDPAFTALLHHVKTTFSDPASKGLRRFLVRAKQNLVTWSAAHGDRGGCLFVYTSNPSEAWHSRLKASRTLSYRAALVEVFARTEELQKQRADKVARETKCVLAFSQEEKTVDMPFTVLQIS